MDLERNGWEGLCVIDSQNLSGGAYVALAMAATVTERIGLGTAVTNAVTRVAAAAAAGIASVDRVSGGRAVFWIGRGDSSLTHIGRAPARLEQFETYVRHVQTYLCGDAVSFDEIDMPDNVCSVGNTVGLGSRACRKPPGMAVRRPEGAGRSCGKPDQK